MPANGNFKTRFSLPVKDLVAGGGAEVECNSIPDNSRIAGFLIALAGTATAASETSAVTCENLVQLISQLNLDSEFLYIRLSGRDIHCLEWAMLGKPTASRAQSITATTGGVACRVEMYLPLADPRALNPNDTAMPARLIKDRTISITPKSVFTLGLSPEVTVSAVQLRITAILVPESDEQLPVKTRMYFEQWNQQTANLSPGHFSHLICTGDGTLTCTREQYAQMSVGFDGSSLVDRQMTADLIADWNRAMACASDHELSYQAAQPLPFIPLITPPDRKYKLTQLCRADSVVRVDIESGTATTGRYVYRTFKEVSDDDAAAGARKMGHDPDTVKIKIKTASKVAVAGSANRVMRHTRLLPKKLER